MKKIFLLIVVVIVLLTGLSYLLNPFQFEQIAKDVNLIHLVRAYGGLYVGIVLLIVLMIRKGYHDLAISGVIIIMAGLIGGRLLNLLVDPLPSIKMIVSLGIEMMIGIVGLVLLRTRES